MATKEQHTRFSALVENAMPYPPPEVDLSFRPMFGALGLYVRERIFGFILDEGLALKFPTETQEQLLQQAPDAIHPFWTRQYLILPPYIYEDELRLNDWLQLSIDYVLSQPLKRKRRR
jgi:TfoX/Sxy family transcriptional regulator of competence genes